MRPEFAEGARGIIYPHCPGGDVVHGRSQSADRIADRQPCSGIVVRDPYVRGEAARFVAGIERDDGSRQHVAAGRRQPDRNRAGRGNWVVRQRMTESQQIEQVAEVHVRDDDRIKGAIIGVHTSAQHV